MNQGAFAFLGKLETQYGGDCRRGKRKIARPIDPKRPIHLTLRSSRARGKLSMLHPDRVKHVETLTRRVARKRGIRIYRFVNVGNHLHLVLRTPDRDAFRTFLRELAGSIAMLMTGARKGHPLQERFWDKLAWSRIVSWGRDFQGLKRYFIKNIFESTGLLSREQKLAGWRIISLELDRPPPDR